MPPPAHYDPTKRYRQPKGRGPQGRRLCRWCWQEVPQGKRTFCSQACVDSYLADTSWPWLRAKVFERDRGVCADCGLDTQALARELTGLSVAAGRKRVVRLGYPLSFFHAAVPGGEVLLPTRSLWEADHLVPRVERGPDTLANLATRCWPCHNARTQRWRLERAGRKEAAQQGRRA